MAAEQVVKYAEAALIPENLSALCPDDSLRCEQDPYAPVLILCSVSLYFDISIEKQFTQVSRTQSAALK